jgi:hypothetical protein
VFLSFLSMTETTIRLQMLSIVLDIRQPSKLGRSGPQRERQVLHRTFLDAPFHSIIGSHPNKVARAISRSLERNSSLGSDGHQNGGQKEQSILLKQQKYTSSDKFCWDKSKTLLLA